MTVDIRKLASAVACCASAPVVALMVAGAASADPGLPVLPPDPGPVPAPLAAAPAPLAAAPAPLAADPAAPAADPAAPAVLAAPPSGTPHLASPDSLPPGSTMDPTAQDPDGPNVSYLKDLWHAVQNNEISGKQALLLGLAQRNMSTPIPNQAPGPNVPLSPDAPMPQAAPGPNAAAPAGPVLPGEPAPAAPPAVADPQAPPAPANLPAPPPPPWNPFAPPPADPAPPLP